MSEHTPGKASLCTTYAEHEIRGERDELLAISNPARMNDARRLIACWNACDGLSIEQLERAGTLDRASVSRNVAINNTINNLKDEADSLRAVNAELLEALDRIIKAAPGIKFASDAELCEAMANADGDVAAQAAAFYFARAAITKARAMEGEK